MARFAVLTNRVLRDQVKAAIRDAVARGELVPGERISERVLGEQLGVSRLPIREALRQLEEQGLVVTYPHRGSFVCELSREDARDLVYIRVGIERTAFQIIWENGEVESLLSRLEGVFSRMAALEHHEGTLMKTILDLDIEFHSSIIAAAHSPHLSRVWAGIDCFMPWLMLGADAPPVGKLTEDHRVLLESFRSGHLDGALRAIEEHVRVRTLPATQRLQPREDLFPEPHASRPE